MAQSLIDIKDNKLIYNAKLNFKETENIDNPIRIVSIIGKARTGKSTFLNCLLTYWKTDSQNVFAMSKSGNHCTNGIDIYNIPEKHIVLLDFQGIYLGDSSNDPKLLLLAYLVSDIIIFNEIKMLSNITLEQFQPMLSFINYLKGKNDLKDFNPKLIFRICDMSLDIEPTSNMQNMLKSEDDQFQAIRECINELFDTPYAVCTMNLDRSELKQMDNNNFKELLESNENGFNDAISKINDYVECCESKKTMNVFLTDISKIIKNINEEKAIDFKKLDIVKSLGDIQIRDWIDALGTGMYNDITVDGTSETYKKVIERIETRDRIIKDIDKIFKSIPKTIRDERIEIVKKKINEKIENANLENTKKANKLMEDIISKNLLIPNKFSLAKRLENVENINFNEWIEPFIVKLTIIKDSARHIHNVALLPFCKWKIQIIKDIKERFDNELAEIKEFIKEKDNALEKYYKDIENDLDTSISEFVIKNPLDTPYSKILNDYKIKIYNIIDKILQIKSGNEYTWNNFMIYSFECDNLPNIYNGEVKINIDARLSNANDWNIDFLRLNNAYKTKINELLESKGIELIAKYRTIELTKKGNLEYQFGTPSIYSSIQIINNPKTQFISFEPFKIKYGDGILKPTYMTEDYYNNTIEPILLRTCKHLFTKDYVYNENEPELNGWLKFLKDITDIKIPVPDVKIKIMSFDFYKTNFQNDYKRLAMLDIFENRFKKELLRKG